MLLDAEWSNLEGCFVQKKVINGLPVHTYFDAAGNYIPASPNSPSRKKRHVAYPKELPSGASFWSRKLQETLTKPNVFDTTSTTNAAPEEYDDILFGTPVKFRTYL